MNVSSPCQADPQAPGGDVVEGDGVLKFNVDAAGRQLLAQAAGQPIVPGARRAGHPGMSGLRALRIGLVLVALCCAQARADDAGSVSSAGRQAIEQVIGSQLEAFRRDAGDAAFALASPKIQTLFGNPANFMAMVRQGYPPVYRPRSFQFEQLVTIDDRIVQRVTIIGPDGTESLALYTMEQEPDGTWRIDGCALLDPEKVTT